jgi:endonuclease/exonuclease/phosphatase family metal-dependent hydrolase
MRPRSNDLSFLLWKKGGFASAISLLHCLFLVLRSFPNFFFQRMKKQDGEIVKKSDKKKSDKRSDKKLDKKVDSKKKKVSERVVIDLTKEPEEEKDHCAHRFGTWNEANVREIPISEARWLEQSPSALKIVSWNVLADAYTFAHFYKHLERPKQTMAWAKRVKMIVETLHRLDADVYCLQEVDHWPELCALMSQQYDGVFESRTGHKQDGLAILWKRSALALVGEKAVLKFDDLMGKNGESRIALRICLNALHVNRLVVVAQTHLDYKRPHAQVEMCRLLGDFVKAGMRETRDACIVMGDFNSEIRSHAVQTLLEACPRLISAVPQKSPQGSPVITACIKDPKAIDHMFFDRKFLVQNALVAPFMSSAKLPNDVFPSDHYPIGAGFDFVAKE